ncbi:MAG: hypothetical protein UU65_C0003G0089 [candidate division CPR2 bacterium GW2011_GWC1_41_48]|uniref:Uncharacterized protein n=1 Tax=candidate division CPR2 bacterium GW2011_GWC1_41_48 TaxID=1618344 RepID=A0A0G0W7P5_UNCC2|nr:MAG: hypothetical protein UT47_C0003G0095 [candidate division CPR2 bacterium GW2011_GWC2_39_35]KKR28808.1 MAG: hypothetical protein UT60_C0012G0016 [candidate division CPR2 bacterium GW2011_GWD2_39_7]KKR29321.1 MAG: hypothetical protein UT59_C0009G0011 [candidate division CPR2 bacterium GW2011_GWD1_39_7]KKS09034.1 MAG: hypothetical protein UU65_C0003G0089 [candidate division CPR2 bacterium GW2011_GWC1_41_48]
MPDYVYPLYKVPTKLPGWDQEHFEAVAKQIKPSLSCCFCKRLLVIWDSIDGKREIIGIVRESRNSYPWESFNNQRLLVDAFLYKAKERGLIEFR